MQVHSLDPVLVHMTRILPCRPSSTCARAADSVSGHQGAPVWTQQHNGEDTLPFTCTRPKAYSIRCVLHEFLQTEYGRRHTNTLGYIYAYPCTACQPLGYASSPGRDGAYPTSHTCLRCITMHVVCIVSIKHWCASFTK